jgi:molecular chaperone HscB
MDPFAVLGLSPVMDVPAAELERRYLQLSRECHPDRHRDAGAEQQIALLSRAAAVNDAYRIVRDPWLRAEALVRRADATALDRAKGLSADFLARALELAERVDEARGTAAASALRDEVAALVAVDLERVREALAAGDLAAAAVALHQSRYHRKALADLGAGIP